MLLYYMLRTIYCIVYHICHMIYAIHYMLYAICYTLCTKYCIHCAMLCYAMLCYTTLYYTLLYYTMLYYTILYHTMYRALKLVEQNECLEIRITALFDSRCAQSTCDAYR